MKKTRRLATEYGILKADPSFWEAIHFLTMTLFGHRIVRGYDAKTGKLVKVFWDRADNWSDEGSDWHRLDVPYPAPIWTRCV